jgi:hypothetical protein
MHVIVITDGNGVPLQSVYMQSKSAETDLWRGMCKCVCMIVNCLYKKLLAMRKYGSNQRKNFSL